MAQRTVHVLFGTILAQRLSLPDVDRFLVGSILPDAYVSHADRDVSHYIKVLSGTEIRCFDFHEFWEQFRPKIMKDSLYLGYYAHLLEDAFYRFYLYREKDMFKRIKSSRLDVLYRDYHILNSFITNNYPLPQCLKLPTGFQKEAINGITAFDLRTAVADYANDISERAEGKTVLLTEPMLEEFVSKYLQKVEQELRSVQNGFSSLNPLDYLWRSENRDNG